MSVVACRSFALWMIAPGACMTRLVNRAAYFPSVRASQSFLS